MIKIPVGLLRKRFWWLGVVVGLLIISAVRHAFQN